MNEVKSMIKSKTFWIAILQFFLAVLSAPEAFKVIQDGPTVISVYSLIIAVIMIALRRITNTPVTLSGK